VKTRPHRSDCDAQAPVKSNAFAFRGTSMDAANSVIAMASVRGVLTIVFLQKTRIQSLVRKMGRLRLRIVSRSMPAENERLQRQHHRLKTEDQAVDERNRVHGVQIDPLQ